ncbi:hypothetical protein [Serinicoccus sp. LYQ131]|uniref:hypothetical protein n=1 Tax=Serinicoccus sp. LYQ131 TaxID=3378797 RepID=UPI003852BA52
MSAVLWLVVGELLLGRHGPAMTLVVIAFLAAAASTPLGERWLAYLALRARAPRLHQRHTLAPVAHVLLHHGLPSGRWVLLVVPHRQVDVTGFGRRTLIVSEGLLEEVRSRHISAATAASLIAHELGVMRVGLTRHEPAMMVLLAPWKVWLTCALTLWGLVATFLPRRLLVMCMIINAGVGIWLGATGEPAMYLTPAVMSIVLGTWWTLRSWDRARAQIGDRYLLQTGLSGVYADLLGAEFTDDYTRDRAVRLSCPPNPEVTAPADYAPRAGVVTHTVPYL